jgi:hypothetical protein
MGLGPGARIGTVRDAARECGHRGVLIVVGDELSECGPDVGSGGAGDADRGVGGAVGIGVLVGSAMVPRCHNTTIPQQRFGLLFSLWQVDERARNHNNGIRIVGNPGVRYGGKGREKSSRCL